MITRLFEVAIAVKDFDAAVKKFTDVLGVEPIFVKEESMPTPGDRCASFPVGDVVIAILSPRQPDSPVAKFLEARGEGVFVVDLEVTDIEETMRELGEKGVEFASDRPVPYGYGKLNFANPKSMHGVLFAFAQHDEGYYERVLRGE
jgi:methylmalonyl-CoA/ethylmalonyl-CoA epimerase